WEGNGRCNLGLLYQEQGRGADARVQFDIALTTAREVGFVRLAYTVLCNLGILLAAEGRLAEAAEHLQEAVKGAIANADRRSEGQFRGSLALALAKQGRIDEAHESLDRGEALLIASADRLSHALLLCDRAEIELMDSRTEAAGAALKNAQRIADELDCRPESELRRRLGAISAALLVS
ncbi:MAG TPA: tetratricopeptide repeat protein, partial [Caldimonas sp.]|nr:tetratricopeptide repeat protein [Caldimonas sp.]